MKYDCCWDNVVDGVGLGAGAGGSVGFCCKDATLTSGVSTGRCAAAGAALVKLLIRRADERDGETDAWSGDSFCFFGFPLLSFSADGGRPRFGLAFCAAAAAAAFAFCSFFKRRNPLRLDSPFSFVTSTNGSSA